ncbi:prepilin peptidase [Bacillus mexicanus]|uniref:A24 family peptidase n=1 Tax=Bacillus mexicanus TaxID=2834415 RepID=UPI003D262F8F
MLLLIVSLFLLTAAVYDWRTMEIPNWIPIAGIIIAVTLNLFHLNDISFGKMLLNALIVFVPLFLLWAVTTLFHFKAIGAGDVKLFGVTALFIPLTDSFLLILITLVLGSIIALCKIHPKRFIEMFEDLSYFLFYGIPGKSEEQLKKVPLGPALFLAFMFYLTPYYDLFSSYWR